jgi:predicted peroxiredoxin
MSHSETEPPVANNPKFQKVLEKLTVLHNKKSNDYAQNNDYYSNFKFAAFVAGVTVDQVFRVMLGIKLARLKELKSGKTPNFESIQDTILDLANYGCIYASYDGPQKMITSPFDKDLSSYELEKINKILREIAEDEDKITDG